MICVISKMLMIIALIRNIQKEREEKKKNLGLDNSLIVPLLGISHS
jgi:hypothetical protein